MSWPKKGSLIITQTRILVNRLYYTRKIELHRKGKSRTVRITSILICPLRNISVLITMRRVHYGKMGKAPTTIYIYIYIYIYNTPPNKQTFIKLFLPQPNALQLKLDENV